MTKIIGLTGKMGSGKSTAIKCLQEIQHNKIHLVKFAQTLYNIQEDIYKRISPVYTRPAAFVKDRKLLQFLGTDWGRDVISKDLWTDLWKKEVGYVLENYTDRIIVVDDVRFDNEAEAVKSMGGIIILVESNHNSERIDIKAGIPGHKSESGVDLKYIDYVLENNGSIDDLKSSLLTLNVQKALW